MADVLAARKLSHSAVLKMLQAAEAKARELGSPMGIVVANPHGAVVGSLMMDGAKFWSLDTSAKKAKTAAALGKPTGGMPPEAADRMSRAIAEFTNLVGGVPIVVDGESIGGIAAGGGSSEQDLAVAQAGADTVIA